MSYCAETFFNNNVQTYQRSKLEDVNDFFIKFINSRNNGIKRSLIDIGGGNGIFAKTVREECQITDVTVLDPSETMLEQIGDEKIKKVLGSLPYGLNVSETFDYAVVKEVLHHVVSPSADDSKRLAALSLDAMGGIIKEDGYLFIHELYYESYIVPSLTRSAIYYLCSIQNSLRFRLLPKEFLIGLKVHFYTRDELKQLILESGFEIESYCEESWNVRYRNKKRLLFLKDWGRILVICKKTA